MCITFGVLSPALRARGAAAPCRRLRSRPSAAGERLDVFLAAARRLARRGAAADRRGRVRVDGEAQAEAPRAARRRDDRGRGAPRRRPRRDVPDARVRDRLRGRAPAGGRQARRASSCTRRAGTRAGTLAQALAGRVGAAGGDPERAGRRPPARPRHVRAARASRAPRRSTRRCRRALRRARDHARVPRAGRGPPAGARAARSTRRSAATAACAPGCRPTPTTPRAAVTHFETERALRRLHAAAGAARDRPHAPDPRAPAGDRPPGGRRPRVRPRRARSGSSASSCTPSGSRSSTRSRASGSRSARRCPATSPAALERGRAAIPAAPHAGMRGPAHRR